MLDRVTLDRRIQQHWAGDGSIAAPYDRRQPPLMPDLTTPVRANPVACQTLAVMFADLAPNRVVPTCIEGWTIVSQTGSDGVYRELLITRRRGRRLPPRAVFTGIPADPDYMSAAIEYALRNGLPFNRPKTSNFRRHAGTIAFFAVVALILLVYLLV